MVEGNNDSQTLTHELMRENKELRDKEIDRLLKENNDLEIKINELHKINKDIFNDYFELEKIFNSSYKPFLEEN